MCSTHRNDIPGQPCSTIVACTLPRTRVYTHLLGVLFPIPDRRMPHTAARQNFNPKGGPEWISTGTGRGKKRKIQSKDFVARAFCRNAAATGGNPFRDRLGWWRGKGCQIDFFFKQIELLNVWVILFSKWISNQQEISVTVWFYNLATLLSREKNINWK